MVKVFLSMQWVSFYVGRYHRSGTLLGVKAGSLLTDGNNVLKINAH